MCVWGDFNAARHTITTKSNRLLDRHSEVMGQCAKYGDEMAVCQTNIPDKTLPTVLSSVKITITNIQAKRNVLSCLIFDKSARLPDSLKSKYFSFYEMNARFLCDIILAIDNAPRTHYRKSHVDLVIVVGFVVGDFTLC